MLFQSVFSINPCAKSSTCDVVDLSLSSEEDEDEEDASDDANGANELRSRADEDSFLGGGPKRFCCAYVELMRQSPITNSEK